MKTFEEIRESVRPTPPPLEYRREGLEIPKSMINYYMLLFTVCGLIGVLGTLTIAFFNRFPLQSVSLSYLILVVFYVSLIILLVGRVSCAKSVYRKYLARKEAMRDAWLDASTENLRLSIRSFEVRLRRLEKND